MKLLNRIDLGALLSSGARPPSPGLWARTDGACLLYEGLITGLWGRPESGKSMLGQHIATTFIQDGGAVFYVDFEQGAYVAAARFGQLGLTPTQLTESLYYYPQLQNASIEELIEEIDTVLDSGTPVLFLLDSADTLLASLGISPNDQESGTKINDLLFNPLRTRAVTGLIIDHVSTANTPAKERGPMGSTHKLSEVDAGFLADMVKLPVPGGRGHVKLWLDKDRHGGVRQGAANPPQTKMWVAGEAFISSERDPDTIEVWVDPPNAAFAPAVKPHWQVILGALALGPHDRAELESVLEADGIRVKDQTVKNALLMLNQKTVPNPAYEWNGKQYVLTDAGRTLAGEVLSVAAEGTGPPDGGGEGEVPEESYGSAA